MKKFFLHLFLLLVLLVTVFCFGQTASSVQKEKDSLLSLIKTTADKKKLAWIYIDLSEIAKISSNDSTKLFATKALQLAQEINDEDLIARAYNYLGIVDMNTGHYPEALKKYVISTQIYEKLNDTISLPSAYINMANIYLALDDFDLAIPYYKKAISFLQNNDKNYLSIVYNNLAVSYINKSKLENNLKLLDSATYYTLRALEKNKQNNNLYYQSFQHTNLGEIAYAKKEYQKAVNHFKTAEEIKKQFNGSLIAVHTNLANTYVALNNKYEAEKYFQLALAPIKDKPGFFREKKILYNDIANFYAGIKDYQKAFYNHKKYYAYSDSLFNETKAKQLTETEAKFKTAQKDKEIAQQKLQLEKERSQRNKWIFGSLALLLLGFTGFQWRNSIQKRKKLLAENKLENEKEINELRTKFLGNIAHEIRTPLTLISGNLELAKENIDKKEKALQNIDVALVNSKKVVEDANEILELLKFEKNKTTIKLNTVNLNQTLKRIFLSFASLAEMKHLTLDYQSNIPENVTAKIDVDKVEKILNNLISNAIKYSPANNKIIFDAQLSQDQLTVKVTDFGQGIHFNETEKIFERFYQSSQSNAVGGIGIGLSLAKEFAELLNGSLTVESELGKGSTFVFNLPVEITSSQTQEVENITPARRKVVENNVSLPEDTPVTPQNKEKPNILIVEDNPEMCNYIVEILKDIYHCDIAFDGMEALEKVKSNSYDLITSDIMMPRLDGFQLREKLNENDNLKNIPFILISAKTLPEDKIKGFSLGIDDYVVKPFNKNELIARIDNLLINKKDREQWLQENEPVDESLDTSEKQLLSKIEETVINNISNEEFKVAQLASEIGYSQRQLTRILKQYTGMSPVKFILEIRLQKAYKLLQSKSFFTLSEVRFDVGIPSSSYFNRKFKERFGISPSELL